MTIKLGIAAVLAAAGGLTAAGAWAAGAAQPLRLAQATDIRQEDRRADRREDRQEDRRADRREDRQEDRRADRREDRQEDRRADRREDRQEDRQADRRMDDDDNPAQVRVPLERGADGTVDVDALLDALAVRLDEGARELQIRNGSLTQEEARDLLLAVDAGQNLLARIGGLLPGDGLERSVRFKGAVDARVQRQPDGSLRLNIRDVDLGDLAAAQLATDLATLTGFDRVRIRGVDADGNRIRVEYRADKGLTHDQVRADRRGGGGEREARREDRSGHRGGRAERIARRDRSGRAERPERRERAERPERAERAERAERPERVERIDRSGPSERVERVERVESGNSGRH